MRNWGLIAVLVLAGCGSTRGRFRLAIPGIGETGAGTGSRITVDTSGQETMLLFVEPGPDKAGEKAPRVLRIPPVPTKEE